MQKLHPNDLRGENKQNGWQQKPKNSSLFLLFEESVCDMHDGGEIFHVAKIVPIVEEAETMTKAKDEVAQFVGECKF